MAVIKAQTIQHGYSNIAEVRRWPGVTEADTCEAIVVPHKADKSVQVIGDFGAAGAVEMRGALAPDAPASDFVTLNDPQGNPLSFTANKIEAVLENAYFMAPAVAAGTGLDVTIVLLIKK